MTTLTVDEAMKIKDLIIQCTAIITNTDKSLEGSVSELMRFLGAEYQVADNVTQEKLCNSQLLFAKISAIADNENTRHVACFLLYKVVTVTVFS